MLGDNTNTNNNNIWTVNEWAKKAIIMSAYSSYKNRDYVKAEANLNRFLNLYPASNLAAYAQYLLGMNYFDQIIEVSRDQTSVTKSLTTGKAFIGLITNGSAGS